MIVKLKMLTTGKSFSKISVQKLSDIPFFHICGLQSTVRWCLKQTSLDAFS